jgi:hypothetical protein
MQQLPRASACEVGLHIQNYEEHFHQLFVICAFFSKRNNISISPLVLPLTKHIMPHKWLE